MKLSNPQPRVSQRTLIWDVHTRLFHWTLVLLFTGLLVTGLGEDLDWMVWHQRFGYCMLGLLMFRLLTGIWGSDYGNFGRFPLRPSDARAYLAGQFNRPGHNPLGSWMILLMLLVLAVQTFSGLLTSDDIFVEGPWVYWADEDWVALASFIHANNWIVIAVLVSLHLLAVLAYLLIKRQNLIQPMLSGYVNTDAADLLQPAIDNRQAVTPRWRLAAALLVAALTTWALIELPG